MKRIKKPKQKFLLIGWDAADWRVIHPLLDAGKMPALELLINYGVMGDLAVRAQGDSGIRAGLSKNPC